MINGIGGSSLLGGLVICTQISTCYKSFNFLFRVVHVIGDDPHISIYLFVLRILY